MISVFLIIITATIVDCKSLKRINGKRSKMSPHRLCVFRLPELSEGFDRPSPFGSKSTYIDESIRREDLD